jgi:ankyrin repeat protein
MHQSQNLLFSSSAAEVQNALKKKCNIDKKELYDGEFFADCKFSAFYDYRYDPGRITALQHACLTGNESTALTLIRAGADINILDSEKASILQMAALSNMGQVLEEIADRVDINYCNQYGTALHIACKAQSTKSALLLLDHGADISVKLNGFTPAQAACKYYNKQILTKMLRLQSQPFPINDALFFSCTGNNINPVKFLLKNGADLSCRDNAGRTLLHAACTVQGPSYKVADFLLKQGLSVNEADSAGNTPLHLACESHNMKMIELLVECGADVNISNNAGNTPLLYCAKKGRFHMNIYKLLEKAHPDIAKRNKAAKTVLDYITPAQKESLLSKAR